MHGIYRYKCWAKQNSLSQDWTEVLRCLWTLLLVCCFSGSHIWCSAQGFWEFAQPVVKMLFNTLLLITQMITQPLITCSGVLRNCLWNLPRSLKFSLPWWCFTSSNVGRKTFVIQDLTAEISLRRVVQGQDDVPRPKYLCGIF